MDGSDPAEEKMPSIPTVVLDHDDEPGPPTELSAIKECVDEVSSANLQPESPCHKVWAQHTPQTDTEVVQSEEKDVYLDVSEVEAIMSKPDHKITVRILRRILSIMMVILYKTDMEIANKRKMKSLWDRRPADWPAHVPFKDPNNGVKLANGKHGQKPVHKELLMMYQFLKKKYQREVRILTTGETNNLQGFSGVKEEPLTPVDPRPMTPLTPKLEPITSLPQESGAVVRREEARSITPEIPPQVVVPDGMEVRVEYVNPSVAPPSPDAGRLHHVLEAQYQRLVEHFTQVQTLVNAYNPTAADDFEKMGKELECLLEETRNQPEKFSLIFNDVGHKVESFLSKVQLLHAGYVTSPMFAKECQALATEIHKRTDAALSLPPHQTMQVGMVLDRNPAPPDQALMSVVSQRVASQIPAARCDKNKKLEADRSITTEDLASALDQTKPGSMEMKCLLSSLDVIKERPLSSPRDYDDTCVKVNEMEEADKEIDVPTTEEVIEDVLNLETAYGCCPFSPPESAVSATELLSPDQPRYVGDDPAIFSLHQSSPYSADISDAMVVTVNDDLDRVEIFSPEDEAGGDSYPDPEHTGSGNPNSPTVEVPLTVVSMETDHEDDHFDLRHQGMVEEVYTG